MHRVRVVVSALALVSVARSPMHVVSQPTHGALQDSLETLERASWVAWQRRDSAFFRRFLAADHVELGFFGAQTRDQVVAGVGSPACVVEHYEVSDFHLTRFDARTAVLTYHAAQATRCNGTPVPSPVWVSSLYVERDGRWVNALYQQTSDLRARRNPT